MPRTGNGSIYAWLRANKKLVFPRFSEPPKTVRHGQAQSNIKTKKPVYRASDHTIENALPNHNCSISKVQTWEHVF
jgi:hypothetical protein